jgi:RluA family pseudouridine synthase
VATIRDLPDALRVLFQDESVLALDKPAGALSVPGRSTEDEPALSQLVRAIAPSAMPVHRLDRGTSGVLLFALGPVAHRALNQIFESRRAEKRYLALSRGQLLEETLCELPLAHARAGGMRLAREGEPGALPSSTDFRPLERFAAATLIECRPRTGRTHQLRVHLAALGLPLLIDPRYAPEASAELFARDLDARASEPDRLLLNRTPLHAAAIRLPHPSGKGYLSIESPTPPDFTRCLEQLRLTRRKT